MPKSPSDPTIGAGEIGADVFEAAAAERDHLAGRQHGAQAEHVIERHPVLEAVRAAGIEGDVAADRADRLARRIGRVVQAVLLGRERHVEIEHAGLHHGDPIDRIDLEDAIQPVQRDDDPIGVRHGAAGEAGAAAARDERHLRAMTQADRFDHLVGRLRRAARRAAARGTR